MAETAILTRLEPRTRWRQWTVVGLLITAGVVNYLDRSTLSIANTTIKSEMNLDDGQMGILFSAFAWAYALSQLPAGRLTDRFGPRVMLGLSMILWSIAQTVAGAVRTLGEFLTVRLALGLAESPMFTAGARAIVDWFPLKDRGLPLGLFNSASSLGPAIAPLLLTPLMLAYGWRIMFLVMGAASVLVAVAWFLSYRDPQHAAIPQADIDAIRAGEPGGETSAGGATWAQFFAIPATWAMMGGLFGIVYVTWLYVSWLPGYLETVRHVSRAETGVLAAIPQFAGFIGGCLGGLFSDWLAHGKYGAVAARKIPTVAGLLLAAGFTAAAPFAADTGWVVALMSVGMFFAYASGSCSWALGASLTPPNMVASLEAIQNVGGSIGGALGPLVTGFIVKYTGSFTPAFLVAAVVAVASAVSYALVGKDAYVRLSQ